MNWKESARMSIGERVGFTIVLDEDGVEIWIWDRERIVETYTVDAPILPIKELRIWADTFLTTIEEVKARGKLYDPPPILSDNLD